MNRDDYWRYYRHTVRLILLWMVAAVTVSLLLLPKASGAPLPFPKKINSPFQVGFKFRYWNYGMKVYAVEPGAVLFEGIKSGYRDWTGGNRMSYEDLRKLLMECPQDFIPD